VTKGAKKPAANSSGGESKTKFFRKGDGRERELAARATSDSKKHRS
jgi:hypothetical protein